MTIYEHVMAVRTPAREDFTTKDYLDARDALIRTEISGVGDRLTGVVNELKVDMDDRLGTIDSQLQLRPTTSNLHRSVATGIGALFVALLAVLAALWAAVDTGASMTSAFSEDVLETRASHQAQQEQIQQMNASYQEIDQKLDQLIAVSASENPPQGQSAIDER